MQVVSTNIGKKQQITWRGQKLYTGIYKYPVNESILLGVTDVYHDDVMDRRYHGGNDKACYLYSEDHYAYWRNLYPNLDWHYGMFGENLTVAGLNEADIHIGAIYKLGTALVQITQPRQPCYKLGIRLENPKAVKQFVRAELPGAYIRVLKPGAVKTGDTMVLVEEKPENFSLKTIFHLIYQAKDNLESIKKAITMPELAESCRKDLTKYAGL